MYIIIHSEQIWMNEVIKDKSQCLWRTKTANEKWFRGEKLKPFYVILWICVSAKFIVDCVCIIFLEQRSQKNVPLGSNMSNVTNQNGTGLEQQVGASCTSTSYWFFS